MREKLLKLMRSEKLSSSRLAEMLEIQPSSISHILSGRNKPSFDFLVKILRRFPTLNPDWLLLDAEQMYRSSDNLEQRLGNTSQKESQPQHSATTNMDQLSSGREVSTEQPKENSTNRPMQNIGSLPVQAKPNADIERVIVLYSDKSFEAFYLK